MCSATNSTRQMENSNWPYNSRRFPYAYMMAQTLTDKPIEQLQVAELLCHIIKVQEDIENIPKSKYKGATLLIYKAIEAQYQADLLTIIGGSGVDQQLSLYDKYMQKFDNKMRILKDGGMADNNGVKPEWIEQAKQASIVDVLASYGIQVMRSACLCPFHHEKTPSCHIYKQDNKYHCFGCGKHGDVIDLFQFLSGYTFPQAVIELRRY